MLPPLPLHEALSGASGTVSIACWVFVLVPQLVKNYRLGNADGVSLAFLFTWFVGDATNLIGAIWAGLVPTVVALAVYFCFADFVLIFQCLYYRKLGTGAHRSPSNKNRESPKDASQEPLLGERRNVEVGSGTSDRDPLAPRDESIAEAIYPSDKSKSRSFFNKALLSNMLAVLVICLVGIAAWAIAWLTGLWRPTADSIHEKTTQPLGAIILGYISAVCYLGARLPQIMKNFRDKSCEGLSLLFFVLSLLGNLTYGAGILCHSLERNYVLTNVPWLLGSLGTMFEDIAIFFQFHIYASTADRHISQEAS